MYGSYGSGHLHRIAFDGETVTDIERDRLHRETGRTQGRLASRYTLDPLGRLKSQLAVPAGPSESKGKAAVTAAVKRSYGYDRTGNLTQSTDPRTGTTQFEYDKLGRITRAGDELFAFDPAHNIVDIPARPSENMPEGISAAADKAHTATVKDNRIKTYDGAEYYYDTFGNLTFMSLPDGSSRTLSYDLKDRLVLAEIWREGGKEIWRYEYDALDRRIAKEQVEVGEEHRPAADGKGRLKTVPGSRIEFVWDGSHLLQEIHPHGSYTYVYTDQDSYEPLAQICEWEDEAGGTRRQVNYFHCDQISLPREMTDGEGRLLWFGNHSDLGGGMKTNIVPLPHTKISSKSIRFQHHFHGLIFGGVFEHVVGFFQFAEFETVGQHFGVIDGTARNCLHQHFGGIGVYQTGCDGEVFNPEFFKFEINGLTVYADDSDMTARFDDVLTHIPCSGDTDGFNRAVHAVFADDGKDLFGYVT